MFAGHHYLQSEVLHVFMYQELLSFSQAGALEGLGVARKFRMNIHVCSMGTCK